MKAAIISGSKDRDQERCSEQFSEFEGTLQAAGRETSTTTHTAPLRFCGSLLMWADAVQWGLFSAGSLHTILAAAPEVGARAWGQETCVFCPPAGKGGQRLGKRA